MRDVFNKPVPQTKRVVVITQKILRALEEFNVKGTFFVLGKVAEDFPELVKRIDREGHEIGIHGYDHFKFHEMNYEKAKDQLKRAKNVVENLTGAKVLSHRAPAFSINDKTKWALELLAELDFKYDSSIMPCKATHYGWQNFPKDIVRLSFSETDHLYEFPMSVLQLGGREIPILGGSYFRLMPYWFSKYSMKKISKNRHPVIYLHPYELDTNRYPDYYFEELKNKSFSTNLKMRSMWLKRASVEKKLRRLLENYKFKPMNEILDDHISKHDIETVKITSL